MWDRSHSRNMDTRCNRVCRSNRSGEKLSRNAGGLYATSTADRSGRLLGRRWMSAGSAGQLSRWQVRLRLGWQGDQHRGELRLMTATSNVLPLGLFLEWFGVVTQRDQEKERK